MEDSWVEIYAFRHGQTDWNVEGRVQGHLDIPLNAEGRRQAEALGPRLVALQVQSILSSDLCRAHETARLAVGQSGIAIHTHAGLREICLGQAQGLTRSEIEARFGPVVNHLLRSTPLTDGDIVELGSETGEQVRVRAVAAIEEFVRSANHARIGIATHGGVLRRLVQHAALNGEFPAPIPNGIIYPLAFAPKTGKWKLPDFMPWSGRIN